MNDRNIYTNYDKNDNLISINFKNQRYDLTKMTKEEAIKDILKQDESIKKDIKSGKVKFIKTVLDDEMTMTDYEKELLTKFKQEEEPKKVKRVRQTSTNDDKIRRETAFSRCALAIALLSIVTAYGIVHYNKFVKPQKLSLENEKGKVIEADATLDLESEVLTNAKENVESAINNFITLKDNYKIDNKTFYITSEEWLTAYLYLNGYDYTIQDLKEILKDNPDFYSKMSNNYRSFCETASFYSSVADIAIVNKDFFINEEAYNIYMNYWNTFKEARDNPSKENKAKLEKMTKEMYGLEPNKGDINYDNYPGVLSFIGHTIVPAGANYFHIITQDTYDKAMGIYKYDKNGNLLETHGKIEMITCDTIEIQRFDKLNDYVTSSEVKFDNLMTWFNEMNSKLDETNKVTSSLFFEYFNKKKNKNNNNNNSKNSNKGSKGNSSSNSKPSQGNSSIISRDEAVKVFGEAEVKKAEDEAKGDFEKDYQDEIAKENARKQGILDANSRIESYLNTIMNDTTALLNASSSDITQIGNSVKAGYTGSYASYYNDGVDAAVSSGIAELKSMQEQYRKALEDINTNSFNDTESLVRTR